MRRAKNRINALLRDDGSTTQDIQEMQEMTNNFYNTLYTLKGAQDMQHVLDTVPSKVNPQMNDCLTAPYTSEEVKTTLFQMAPM